MDENTRLLFVFCGAVFGMLLGVTVAKSAIHTLTKVV